MVGGARRRRFTRYRCRTGGPRRRVPPWIIQQNIFSEERFHGALPITLHDMLFEMPAGLDPLPIPPNDDILLPDDDLPPPPVQKPKAKRKRKEIKFPDRGRARAPVRGHPFGARSRHLPARLPGWPACVRS